ncbi:MAG: radical SAM protein [Bacillota bacterium]
MKKYIIPIFVPHMGCPFQCVFCDQLKISGAKRVPDIQDIIETHLKTINKKPGDGVTEVAFYGGSFTAIKRSEQEKLLSMVNPYLVSGLVDVIRISTRPDFINNSILSFLKYWGVSIIELGAQSLDDQVLKLSGRGHTVYSIYQASKLIKTHGLKLGIQLMPGLPGETMESMADTIRKTTEIKPSFVRIYPTIVIKDTPLHQMWGKGNFRPMTLLDSIEICAKMYREFKDCSIDVIRMGLQPSDDLAKHFVVAGPYHPAFGELVLNKVAYQIMLERLYDLAESVGSVDFNVPIRQISIYMGQKRSNLALLQRHYAQKISISGDERLLLNQFRMDTSKISVLAFHKYFVKDTGF